MQKKQQIVSVLEDSIKERKALSRVSGSGVEWGQGALLTRAWGRGGDFFFLIGVYLLYNDVLISVVQQRESVICIHVSPPFSASALPPSHPTLAGLERGDEACFSGVQLGLAKHTDPRCS